MTTYLNSFEIPTKILHIYNDLNHLITAKNLSSHDIAQRQRETRKKASNLNRIQNQKIMQFYSLRLDEKFYDFSWEFQIVFFVLLDYRDAF